MASDKRPKFGGRQKGTPNKSTDYIFELCAKHDFDPIEILILTAKNDWRALGFESPTITKFGFQGAVVEEPVITVDHALEATKTLVSYMYPKRKAIEVTSDSEKPTAIVLAYNQQSLKEAKDKNAKS